MAFQPGAFQGGGAFQGADSGSFAYAQALCFVVLTSNHPAQAQADIKQTYNNFAQAQAQCSVRSFQFAQAQCWVKATSNKHAQTQAGIKATNSRCAQAQCYIPSIPLKKHAQAQTTINTVIIVDNFADAIPIYDLTNSSGTIYQEMDAYTSEAADPAPEYEGPNPADGTWRDEFSNFPSQDAPNGWFRFSLSKTQTVHFDTYEYNDHEHDTIIGIYTGDSGPGDWTVLVGNDDSDEDDIDHAYESDVNITLDAGTYYFQVGFYSGTYSHPKHVHLHYLIDDPVPYAFAQAQVFIYRSEGQAQAAAKIFRALTYYNNLVIGDGADAYYRLNELTIQSSGSPDLLADTAYDSVGTYDLLRQYGYIGYGPIGGQTGIPGTDGDPAVISQGPSTTFNYLYRYGSSQPISSATNWAIEIWVKLITNSQSAALITVGGTGPTASGALTIGFEVAGSNRFYTGVGVGGGSSSPQNRSTGITISTGVWYHLVFTRGSSGNANLYINGQATTDFPNPGTDIDANPPFNTIFINSEVTTVNAYLDEVAVYNNSLTRIQALDHATYGAGKYFVRPAQAQVLINRHFGLSQAQGRILGKGTKWSQAQAFIVKLVKTAQAQAYIRATLRKHAQAQGTIKRPFNAAQAQATLATRFLWSAQAHANIKLVPKALSQANAYINAPFRYSQAQADIKATSTVYGQAQTYIKLPGQGYAQAAALIQSNKKNQYSQAQATVTKPAKYAQAQAKILNARSLKWSQAQAHILITRRAYAYSQAVIIGISVPTAQAQVFISRYHNPVAQAQAVIIASKQAFAQAQAQIGGLRYAQAQAYIAVHQEYIVKYGKYMLPGYAQQESFDNAIRLMEHTAPFNHGSMTEYLGLQNKVLSLRLKVLGDTYLSMKDQTSVAATILRSTKDSFGRLYLQRLDRYYLVRPTSLRVESGGPETRFLEYSIDFDAKPWAFTDEVITISGGGSINTGTRAFTEGTWTPATVLVTGTNVTVSGYTEYGHYTGYFSVSGAVTNLEIDTENYTATINGVNKNALMRNLNYGLYVGPGKTYFAVTGATSIRISWSNRW